VIEVLDRYYLFGRMVEMVTGRTAASTGSMVDKQAATLGTIMIQISFLGGRSETFDVNTQRWYELQVIFSPFDQRVESWRTPTQQFVEKIHKDSADACVRATKFNLDHGWWFGDMI
jgi:hypothetical protein